MEGSHVLVFDADSGEAMQRWLGHTRLVEFVAFSPDGKKVVSTSADGTARIWTLE